MGESILLLDLALSATEGTEEVDRLDMTKIDPGQDIVGIIRTPMYESNKLGDSIYLRTLKKAKRSRRSEMLPETEVSSTKRRGMRVKRKKKRGHIKKER